MTLGPLLDCEPASVPARRRRLRRHGARSSANARLTFSAAIFLSSVSVPAGAVEGPTVAGPIGGSDLRSALLPPPGVYVGSVQLIARTIDFLDKDGKTIPALADAQLTKGVAGPFLTYVPPVKVFGGNVAIAGFVPFGHSCGRLFAGTSRECDAGMGDPYVEIAWARYFGTPRASEFAGAYPIPEGLSVLLGIGAVIPIGRFNESDPLSQALSMGTNIWDWAPTVAVTYTTPPLIGEGTEFSAKVYWNNYIENPDTDYLTGDLINVDFAVTEHIGRFQVGLAGFYAWQIGDDKISGVSFPPDGRRARTLQIGGVVAYDMPEHGASLKLKTMASPFAENTVTAWNVVLGWVKKF